MACTIVATPLAANANSYATIEEGDTYMESRLYSDAWFDVTDDERCRALVMATQMMDTWYEWIGEVASSGQSLLWPRDGAIGPNGYELNSTTIPADIRDACIEWAMQLLAGDRTADSEVETSGIQMLKAGSVFLQFKPGVTAKPIPDHVSVLLSHYGTQRSKTGTFHDMRRA